MLMDNGYKPQFRRKVRGEEPADEMCRKGLGEEPKWTFSSCQKHSGPEFSDNYVLELFACTAKLTKCLIQKGLQAIALDRSSKRK